MLALSERSADYSTRRNTPRKLLLGILAVTVSLAFTVQRPTQADDPSVSYPIGAIASSLGSLRYWTSFSPDSTLMVTETATDFVVSWMVDSTYVDVAKHGAFLELGAGRNPQLQAVIWQNGSTRKIAVISPEGEKFSTTSEANAGIRRSSPVLYTWDPNGNTVTIYDQSGSPTDDESFSAPITSVLIPAPGEFIWATANQVRKKSNGVQAWLYLTESPVARMDFINDTLIQIVEESGTLTVIRAEGGLVLRADPPQIESVFGALGTPIPPAKLADLTVVPTSTPNSFVVVSTSSPPSFHMDLEDDDPSVHLCVHQLPATLGSLALTPFVTVNGFVYADGKQLIVSPHVETCN